MFITPSLKRQSSETFRKNTMNDEKNKHLLSAENSLIQDTSLSNNSDEVIILHFKIHCHY